MARSKRRSVQEIGNDNWFSISSNTIVMAILLTLLVLVYLFFNMKQQKLGSNENEKVNNTVSQSTSNSSNLNTSDLYIKANQFIEQNQLGASVDVEENDSGVILRIKDSLLFEQDNADLVSDSKSLLDKLGKLISTIPNNIVVEGHTDNVQINTYKFQSNWDLSAERAVNVVKFFIDQDNLNPIRFTASGFGEYRPIVDNSTPENRAKNRRIDILIVAGKKESK